MAQDLLLAEMGATVYHPVTILVNACSKLAWPPRRRSPLRHLHDLEGVVLRPRAPPPRKVSPGTRVSRLQLII
jgi:hypothetical protein